LYLKVGGIKDKAKPEAEIGGVGWMYVCTYIRMNGWMDGWKEGGVGKQTPRAE